RTLLLATCRRPWSCSMAKRPTSAVLLAQFVACVRAGLITADGNRSGAGTPEAPRGELPASPDGEAPAAALGIRRGAGRGKNRQQWLLIHRMKRRGEKGSDITKAVNEHRKPNGARPQKPDTVSRFYRENKPAYLKHPRR